MKMSLNCECESFLFDPSAGEKIQLVLSVFQETLSVRNFLFS